MGTEPTLPEIIRRALDSRLLDVHVALPCKVLVFTPGTPPTVEVLPMVRRAIEDDDGGIQHEELPPIPNVPVLFPNSAMFSAAWYLVPGDFVLVIFCSSAIGNWRESGDISDPGDLRRHDLSHAVAIPGMLPKGGSIPMSSTEVVLEVNAPATHIAVGAAATEFIVLADKLVSVFNTHVHATAALGAPSTPTTPITAVQIAATKLKSE